MQKIHDEWVYNIQTSNEVLRFPQGIDFQKTNNFLVADILPQHNSTIMSTCHLGAKRVQCFSPVHYKSFVIERPWAESAPRWLAQSWRSWSSWLTARPLTPTTGRGRTCLAAEVAVAFAGRGGFERRKHTNSVREKITWRHSPGHAIMQEIKYAT